MSDKLTINEEIALDRIERAGTQEACDTYLGQPGSPRTYTDSDTPLAKKDSDDPTFMSVKGLCKDNFGGAAEGFWNKAVDGVKSLLGSDPPNPVNKGNELLNEAKGLYQTNFDNRNMPKL
ncbi:MAG: hypothetical protein H6862_02635 [Rhodospirillales bacterium]|nr:hypothetical protein [Rhodospirillales bacterium]